MPWRDFVHLAWRGSSQGACRCQTIAPSCMLTRAASVKVPSLLPFVMGSLFNSTLYVPGLHTPATGQGCYIFFPLTWRTSLLLFQGGSGMNTQEYRVVISGTIQPTINTCSKEIYKTVSQLVKFLTQKRWEENIFKLMKSLFRTFLFRFALLSIQIKKRLSHCTLMHHHFKNYKTAFASPNLMLCPSKCS